MTKPWHSRDLMGSRNGRAVVLLLFVTVIPAVMLVTFLSLPFRFAAVTGREGCAAAAERHSAKA